MLTWLLGQVGEEVRDLGGGKGTKEAGKGMETVVLRGPEEEVGGRKKSGQQGTGGRKKLDRKKKAETSQKPGQNSQPQQKKKHERPHIRIKKNPCQTLVTYTQAGSTGTGPFFLKGY
jgi:hypothetical protein